MRKSIRRLIKSHLKGRSEFLWGNKWPEVTSKEERTKRSQNETRKARRFSMASEEKTVRLLPLSFSACSTRIGKFLWEY